MRTDPRFVLALAVFEGIDRLAELRSAPRAWRAFDPTEFIDNDDLREALAILCRFVALNVEPARWRAVADDLAHQGIEDLIAEMGGEDES